MKNIKIVVEYDGTNYHGWQSQAKGLSTVQSTLEEVLEKITGEKTRVTGSGRTDSGVHALGQAANFFTETGLDAKTLKKALNSALPRDISVVSASKVPDGFHAQFSSKSKIYEYRIFNRTYPPALLKNRVWHIPKKLDVESMKVAAEFLSGTHDFSAFAAADIKVKTTVRTVLRASLRRNRGGTILFEIEADGFLKRMVRMITGTLAEVGKKKLSPTDFGRILETGRKTKNVVSAPPQGLFLKKVIY